MRVRDEIDFMQESGLPCSIGDVQQEVGQEVPMNEGAEGVYGVPFQFAFERFFTNRRNARAVVSGMQIIVLLRIPLIGNFFDLPLFELDTSTYCTWFEFHGRVSIFW